MFFVELCVDYRLIVSDNELAAVSIYQINIAKACKWYSWTAMTCYTPVASNAYGSTYCYCFRTFLSDVLSCVFPAKKAEVA